MTGIEIYKESIDELCFDEPEEVKSVVLELVEAGIAQGVVPKCKAPGYAENANLCDSASDLTPEEIKISRIIEAMPWTDAMTSRFFDVYLSNNQ